MSNAQEGALDIEFSFLRNGDETCSSTLWISNFQYCKCKNLANGLHWACIYRISLTNLISNFCDSKNYMHGKKYVWNSSLRLCTSPTYCDTCYHMDNTTWKFQLQFEKRIQYLWSDLHNYLKWNPDLQDYLSGICSY